MYFENTEEFRFSVTAKDGFMYSFFALMEADSRTDNSSHLQYYITTSRPKEDWDKIPI
jgi:hypothetical protein